MRRDKGFTLIEIGVVVVICAILAAVAVPIIRGYEIKARMSEMYNTVLAIENAEKEFFLAYGHYAAVGCLDCDPILIGNDRLQLDFSVLQVDIERFRNALGVEIPGLDSTFIYMVRDDGDATRIYVRDRASATGLCTKEMGGAWSPNGAHPWARYLS